MEKVIRIVKKGSDDSNLDYWLSLNYSERMQELEKIRLEVNQRLYGDYKGFQRVFKVVKRKRG